MLLFAVLCDGRLMSQEIQHVAASRATSRGGYIDASRTLYILIALKKMSFDLDGSSVSDKPHPGSGVK